MIKGEIAGLITLRCAVVMGGSTRLIVVVPLSVCWRAGARPCRCAAPEAVANDYALDLSGLTVGDLRPHRSHSGMWERWI